MNAFDYFRSFCLLLFLALGIALWTQQPSALVRVRPQPKPLEYTVQQVDPGAAWMHDAASALAEDPQGPFARYRGSSSLFIPPQDLPFAGGPGQLLTTEARFVLLQAPDGPVLEALLVEPPFRLGERVPFALRHPNWKLGVLTLGMLLLLLIAPRLWSPAPGALYYPWYSHVALPNALATLLVGLFGALPLLLPDSPSEAFSIDRGWIVVTLLLWGLAALATIIVRWTAHYASFELRPLPEGLQLHDGTHEEVIPWDDVERAEQVVVHDPDGEDVAYLRLQVRDHDPVRLWSGIENKEHLLQALRQHHVPVAREVLAS